MAVTAVVVLEVRAAVVAGTVAHPQAVLADSLAPERRAAPMAAAMAVPMAASSEAWREGMRRRRRRGQRRWRRALGVSAGCIGGRGAGDAGGDSGGGSGGVAGGGSGGVVEDRAAAAMAVIEAVAVAPRASPLREDSGAKRAAPMGAAPAGLPAVVWEDAMAA